MIFLFLDCEFSGVCFGVYFFAQIIFFYFVRGLSELFLIGQAKLSLGFGLLGEGRGVKVGRGSMVFEVVDPHELGSKMENIILNGMDKIIWIMVG